MTSFTRLLLLGGFAVLALIVAHQQTPDAPFDRTLSEPVVVPVVVPHDGTRVLPAASGSPPFTFSPTSWRPHRPSDKGAKVCFEDLQAWMPCEEKLQCERKRRMSFPCRPRMFYDNDVWDFCSPAARLKKSVYIVNPPLHVANASVSDEEVWRTISLPLREAWRAVKYEPRSHAASTLRQPSSSSSSADNGIATTCEPLQRRAIVGFAAKFMRPFQVIALVLSAFRAMGEAAQCTRLHLFVTDVEHPLLLHLQALTTPGYSTDAANRLSPSQLRNAHQEGKFANSFLVLEAFDEYKKRVQSSSGNNHRVEVVRINVIRSWLRDGRGRRYHLFVFADTRDAVFMGDVFDAVASTLGHAHALTNPQEEHIYAATEEFPFFRQPRLGLQWNVEVHSTAFGYEMMMLMQKFHLDDYPYMRLINSGVYGGTYDALVDLFEIWGSSAAAVHTETFGVDQPLLGGLLYFGLRMTGFPHKAVLLSGSDGPLRHLYTDGGTEQRYPFMRLELHNGTRMYSDEFMRRVATTTAPPTTDESSVLDASLIGDADVAPGPHQLNCLGERYAVIHQADRYPLVWRSLTEPIAAPTVAWAKAHGVEWTWGPRKPKRKGR